MPAYGPRTPYVELDRQAWAALRAATPLTLTDADIAGTRSLGDVVGRAEVEDVLLPLSRLLRELLARWPEHPHVALVTTGGFLLLARRPRLPLHRYAALDDDSARATARDIWHRPNKPNLVENILPTRGRDSLGAGEGP